MSKQVLNATALALLIGVSSLTLNIASAQNGGEARSTDRAQQKKLDDRELTPIRPIRRVGEDSWPTAKDQPAPVRETTGQQAKDSTDKKPEKKEETAQNTSKPEAKSDANKNLGNQAPPPDKPENTAKQTTQPKQDTAKQDAPKAEPKQDTAKSDTKPDAAKPQNSAQNNAKNTKETTKEDTKGDTKEVARDGAKNADQKDIKGFASIRLGTDENGRVAINDAQEREVAKAIRKQHVDTVNVKVSVGSVAPANVRLVAFSSDMIGTFPQFRGYSFFATREEVVVVEPRTKKVVALIPMKLTATASRPSEERTARTESTTSRNAVRQREVTVGQSAQFDDIPSKEEILAAPVSRGPAGTTVTRTYRGYQYVPDDDDVVVIERRRHRPRLFPFW
jgi:hypothetical protein